MRENRTSGSEGGATAQSVVPTPICSFRFSIPDVTFIIFHYEVRLQRTMFRVPFVPRVTLHARWARSFTLG